MADQPEQPIVEVKADIHNDDCHDYYIARGVVACLGITGITVAVGSIVAAGFGVEVPSETMGLGIAAIGALSALLSKVNK